jgi:hypothetical protein
MHYKALSSTLYKLFGATLFDRLSTGTAHKKIRNSFEPILGCAVDYLSRLPILSLSKAIGYYFPGMCVKGT